MLLASTCNRQFLMGWMGSKPTPITVTEVAYIEEELASGGQIGETLVKGHPKSSVKVRYF